MIVLALKIGNLSGPVQCDFVQIQTDDMFLSDPAYDLVVRIQIYDNFYFGVVF